MRLAIVVVAGLAPLLAQTATNVGQKGSTVTIEINSAWGGMGTPLKATAMITGHDGTYTSGGRKIDAKAVEELFVALDAPVINQPSLRECGADEAWLSANYAKALEEYTHRKLNRLSSKQIDLFKSRLVDLRGSQTDFEELFKHWHTDDFPKVSVNVKADNREFGVQSDSQFPFMLPWHGTDSARGGYTCRISRAVAGVVGRGFPNRDRLLLGDELRRDLTQQTMNSIKHDWDLLDTQNRVGTEVAPVFAQFTVLKSEISNLSSIDLDGGQSWNAELHSSGLPSNFVIGASLSYHGKGLGGVKSLLVDAPQYAALALSVPWLRSYIEGNEVNVEMRYVNGRSISPKAAKTLSEDMQGHDREAVLNALSQRWAENAFLEIEDRPGCWSRAVVLPSRDTLLWEFRCESPLGLPSAHFKTWDCYGWKCVGILIDPERKVRN